MSTHWANAQVFTRRLANGAAGLAQYGVVNTSAEVPVFSTGTISTDQLKVDDEQRAKQGLPLRVGVVSTTNIDLKQQSGARSQQNGFSVSYFQVNAPGALSVGLMFDQLQLAPGARLFVYNTDRTILVGPIEASQNSADYLIDAVEGSSVIVELQEPVGSSPSQIHLSGVLYNYRSVTEKAGSKAYGDSDPCEKNMVCYPNYQTEGDGVALLIIPFGQYVYTCTGSMLNTTKQDFRSMFLTAFHCVDLDESGTIGTGEITAYNNTAFRFNWQSPTCTPTQNDQVYVTLTGATLKAARSQSDFSLFELKAQPPQSESITYLGWDRSSTLPSSPYGIHHPSGDVKKISFSPNPTTLVTVNTANGGYSVTSGTTHLQVTWGNLGVTEGGSSGSPLFNQNRQVVGQLHGGGSYCSTPTAPDQYGRFFTSWNTGTTNDTRLSNWLDPNSVGSMSTVGVKGTVSGPATLAGTGTFGLNSGDASVTSWTVTGGAGIVSPTTGSGNSANLTALAAGTSLTITFGISAGQGYPIKFSKTFDVTAPAATAPVAPTLANQTATVGVAFSYVVPAFSGTAPITYTASGLPAGLTFDASTRTISGSPTTAQISSVTVTGTNSGGSGSGTFAITVNPAPIAPVAPTLANQTATVSVAFSYVVPAFSGTAPITYSASGLPGGLTFDASTRTISGTPTTAQVSTVTIMGTNSAGSGSGNFTITVNPAPVAPVAPTLANQTATVGVAFSYVVPAFTGTAPITYSASGLPGGLSFDASTRTISGSPTTAQTSTVMITGTNSAGSGSGSFSITVNAAPVGGNLAISGVTTSNCEVLSASERRVTFTPQYSNSNGGAISFRVVNETPLTTATGPYSLKLYTDNPTITLEATQSGTTTTFSYNWLSACGNTTPAPIAPMAPTLANLTATVGYPFIYIVPAFAGTAPITYSASGLPAGLSFNVSTHTISGSPTTAQTSTVMITGTNSAGSGSGSFSITVNAAPVGGNLAISGVTTSNCEVLSAGERRVTFTPQYSNSNGGTISFRVVNETPLTTATGPYSLKLYTDNPTITLEATQSGTTTTFSYNWLSACGNTTPAPTAPVAPTLPNQTATVGVAFSYVVPAFNGTAPITYSASGLPAGLVFDAASHSISGTPTTAQVSTVMITGTNSAGSGSGSFTITVNAAPVGGNLAISGVATSNCEVLSAGERRVTFTPQYSNSDATAISFRVVNETLPTAAAGPYSLKLYTDNPIITLEATQSGKVATYSYNWLSACNGNSRIGVAEQREQMLVTVLGNPVVGDRVELEIRGAQDESLRIQATDGQGRIVSETTIGRAGQIERAAIQLGRSTGMYLLRVNTPTQQQVIKLIRQ